MSSHLEKCARSLLVCEKSSFMNEASRHETHVCKHSFNYKNGGIFLTFPMKDMHLTLASLRNVENRALISVLIPECGVLPADIANVISHFKSYFLVRDLPVYKFLDAKFLDTVKKGGFYALSYKTRIDEDNVVALLSSGHLVLSLDKDTYQQLGLEGKPSEYKHRKDMRYVVTVDLTDKSLVPGTKRFQQVLLSLKERVPLKSDFLLTRCPPGAEEDGELQALLSQHTYEECRPTVISRSLTDIPRPSLHPSDLRGNAHSCTPVQFLEWLGSVNLNIRCNNSASSFLSTYVCPEPCATVNKVLLCTVTGFIPPEDVYALLQELRRCLAEPGFTDWVSLTVHGFADSPVSWGAAEHGFLKGGENFYNLVCFKNQDYWLHMATGSQDGCPP